MYSTSPPLMDNLRKIRKANRSAVKDTSSAPGCSGLVAGCSHISAPISSRCPTRIILPFGERRLAVWGARANSFNDPYAGDQGGKLIREHPNVIGTPKAALLTPYSIGAILFAGSFIWLSADLRARDSSDFHTTLGWGMTVAATVIICGSTAHGSSSNSTVD